MNPAFRFVSGRIYSAPRKLELTEKGMRAYTHADALLIAL
jgi:hypothetical protein